MTRILGFALIGAVVVGGAAACSPPGGTDAGTDASDMGTGPCNDGFTPPEPTDAAASNCYRASTCDGTRFCPNTITNNPMRPVFRITQLEPRRPMGLSQPAVRNVLNTALSEGRFGWGIVLDLSANTIRTGALQPGVMPQPGMGLMNAMFRFYSGNAVMTDAGAATRWDPINGMVTLMGETFSSMAVPIITVPAFDETTGALLTELPIRNARFLNVTMNTNRNCIGLGTPTFNSCQIRSWNTQDPMMPMNPVGSIEGDFGADEARTINVRLTPTSMPSLYELLIGGAGCAMTPPMGAGCTPPDTMINGSPTPNAWHVVADFAAVAANVANGM